MERTAGVRYDWLTPQFFLKPAALALGFDLLLSEEGRFLFLLGLQQTPPLAAQAKHDLPPCRESSPA